MRLTVFDPELKFECHSCGNCCTRPWRVVIEEEKIEAIHNFDWAATYPQLAGITLTKTDEATGTTQHVLAKDDKGGCLFFDRTNKKCIIHAELGADAKPYICAKYPYVMTAAPDADRGFVHFSCPTVQAGKGPTLDEQKAELSEFLGSTGGWNRDDVPFVQARNISIESCNLLSDRMAALFDDEDNGDLWDRFAAAIHLSVAVGRAGDVGLEEALRDPAFGTDTGRIELTGFVSLRRSPLTPRMLLGITLWNDFFPADSPGRTVGLRKRISMIMKLMQIVQMRSAYASRLLDKNIPLSRLASPEIVAAIPTESSDLLRRWIRSRIVARSFVINDLTMMAGLHELILDFNAVFFMARSLAIETGAPPTNQMFAEALTIVESRVTSQRRLYRVLFPSWTLSSLESPDSAWSSLRLFHPEAPLPEEDEKEQAASASSK